MAPADEVDPFLPIQLKAFRATLWPSRAYFLRKVMRWFSKTFSTPLEQVEDIPVDDLLQAYYEEQYADMSPEDLEKVRDQLLQTQEQRFEQILAEEADEAEMFEMGKVVAAQEKAKKLQASRVKAQGIADIKTPRAGPLVPKTMPETDLPRALSSTIIPEGITMSFVDDSELDRLDAESMTEPGKK